MIKTKLVPSLLLATSLAFCVAAPRAEAQLNLGSGIQITDVNIDPDNIDIVDGVLTIVEGTVSGTIGGLPFTTDINNFELELADDGAGGACSILNLELGPIDLDLLGLFVDTSRICLDITAMEGGGLLGDLLCDLAGGDLLALERLLGTGEGNLADGLTQILNTGLARGQQGQAAQQMPGAQDICDGDFEILDLAVGPIELNLLGLMVELDNCEGGPVQVCVSASRGEGLLGDLLVGLLGGGLLDGINLGLLENLLGAILDGLGLDLGDLVNIISGALDLNLNPPQGQVRRLTNVVSGALANGALSDGELSQIENAARKIANLPTSAGGLRQVGRGR